MIERTDNITFYKWTAMRFEIDRNDTDFRRIVVDFVYPSVEKVRRNNRIAIRWYYSWKGDKNSLFLRLYFLAKPEHHNNLWNGVELIRKEKVPDILNQGTSESVWNDLTDDIIEWGISLEHVSEMSLMIWRGKFPGSADKYGKSFHHFFEPLLISDKKALEILRKSIGLGVIIND